MITKTTESYKNYGRCVKLSNGKIEAYITVDVGPRIIHFAFINGENIMNTEKDAFSPVEGPEFDHFFGKGKAWNNYGGHRLWTSPESLPETYYPDGDPVDFELTENGAIFTPKQQTENGIAMQIAVEMGEGTEMTIRHKVTNISGETKELALWALTVAAKNGTLIIPMNTDNTGLLHNRQLSIWPYTDLRDERIYLGGKYATIKQMDIQKALKLGFDLNAGTAYYVLGGTVFKKQYDVNHPNGNYPDGGVSFETYSCELFTEVETLSELQTLAKGQSADHTEVWTLYNKPMELCERDDNSIDAFLSQLK